MARVVESILVAHGVGTRVAWIRINPDKRHEGGFPVPPLASGEKESALDRRLRALGDVLSNPDHWVFNGAPGTSRGVLVNYSEVDGVPLAFAHEGYARVCGVDVAGSAPTRSEAEAK